MATTDELRQALSGAVILPEDEGYDEARSIWNAMIDKRPAIIARCAGTRDVVTAVNFARQAGLAVAVKGGGHNVAGLATCEGGIVIDLSTMRGVEVDPENRTACADGGCTWADYDRETHRFGLASTGGAISSTGIAGLTLGGGFGWLSRSYGLACDCLLSAEVVTADGQVVMASADENPDLFWGLRGGGGNFGIVTSFTYRLYEVSDVLAGLLVFPRDQAREVLRIWGELSSNAPDHLGSMAALLNSPDGDPLTGIFSVYNGPVANGEELLAPLRNHPSLLDDGIARQPYPVVQTFFDDGFPPGKRDYWKSHFMNEVTAPLADVLIESAASAPSPASVVLVEHLFGGAVGRVAVDETAYVSRGAEYNLLINAVWDDATDDVANTQWAREVFADLAPFSAGSVYVNYLNAEEGDRVAEAYGSAHYARLVALKDRYDPTNLFHHNQNILPSAA